MAVAFDWGTRAVMSSAAYQMSEAVANREESLLRAACHVVQRQFERGGILRAHAASVAGKYAKGLSVRLGKKRRAILSSRGACALHPNGGGRASR